MIKVKDVYEKKTVFDGNIEKYELWINGEQSALNDYPTEASVSDSFKNMLSNTGSRSNVSHKEDGFTD